MVVTFKDGSKLEEEIAVVDAYPRGARPLARDGYIAKFRDLTQGLVTPEEAARFLSAASGLPANLPWQ